MRVRIEKLIKHLETQLAVAKSIDSEFVYITKAEAEKCLEMAKTKETLLSNPSRSEVEGGGSSWFYVCGECHGSVNPYDKHCRHCGRQIEWNELQTVHGGKK